MEEYYKELLANTTSTRFKKYYTKMLEELHKPKKPKIKQKWLKVYIGSLNKEFRSTRAASFALGEHKNYVRRVLQGKIKNEHNIKYV
jgi:hypothetical protein